MDNSINIPDLLEKAWFERNHGNYSFVEKLLKKIVENAAENDYQYLGRAAHIYMQIAADQNDFETALIHNKNCIAFYKNLKILRLIAHAIRHRADLYFEIGQQEIAVKLYEEAMQLYEEDGYTIHNDYCNALRGYVRCFEESDPKRAIELWEKVRDISEILRFEQGMMDADIKIRSLKG